jgi:hypothetical protein
MSLLDFPGANVDLSEQSWAFNRYGMFPDPFQDIASTMMPENVLTMLRYCEYIVLRQGLVYRTLSRVASYFLTRLKFTGVDAALRKDYEEYLTAHLEIIPYLLDSAIDTLAYGNSFSSTLMRFRRNLVCPTCGGSWALRFMHENRKKFDYNFSGFQFKARCPKCSFRGEWRVHDQPTGKDGIFFRRWPPQEIEILEGPYSNSPRGYIWKLPADLRQQVDRGTIEVLEDVPLEVMMALKNNRWFRFADGVIHHWKTNTLAGIRSRSWGISGILSNFSQAYLVQSLLKNNEAICLDYLYPMRVISPSKGSDGATDPLHNQNLAGFVRWMKRIIAQLRKDPATWQVSPFAFQYQALGGEARNLAPKDIIDQADDRLLNALGVPVELYKGSLQVNTQQAAVRLFESQWPALRYGYNALLQHVADRLARLINWNRVRLTLESPALADDLSKQQTKLQLAAGHDISKSTALAPMGIDYPEELERMREEDKLVRREQSISQKEQDAEGMTQGIAAGQLPGQPGQGPGGPTAAVGGGMGMIGGGPGSKVSPQDVLAQASQIATQLMGMPDSQRTSQLMALKNENPLLHGQVKEQLAQMRAQGAAQGRQMMQQQAQQGMQGG